MRTVVLTFVMLATILFTSARTITPSAELPSSADTLYRLPFPKQSGYALSEGPDNSVLMIFNGKNRRPGAIIRFDPLSKSFRELLVFRNEAGTTPCYRIVNNDNEKVIYGTTAYGGEEDSGILYSLDVVTGERKTLVNFSQFGISHPRYGLIRAGNDLVLGVVGIKHNARLFTYNVTSGQLKFHNVFSHDGEQISNMPALINENTVVVLTQSGGENSFVEYDLKSDQIIHQTRSARIAPHSDLLKGSDGCIYLTDRYGDSDWTDSIEEPLFCFIKFNPVTDTVTRIQKPFDDIAVWGAPLSLDRMGNLIGSYFYGGEDNAGFILHYDPLNDELKVTKEWRNYEAGALTSDAPLLHHSNGLYYGFSYGGGQNEEGRFFSLDPLSGKAIELADFLPQE